MAEFQLTTDALERMAPAQDAKLVSPANADLADGVCDGLLVTAAGNLSLVTKKGTTVAAFPVAAGQLVPIQSIRVLPATTATVLALY